MKKNLTLLLVALIAVTSLSFMSCTTSTLPTEKLMTMYEKRINKTSIFNKLFFNDHKKKKIIYDNIDVFMDENSVGKPFETIGYGSYSPITIPLLRPAKRSQEHNLLYKAARAAYKMKGDGVIIDNQGVFRIIKYKK